MIDARVVQEIRQRGWSLEPFSLSEEEMAIYTASSRRVIELALADKAIEQALNLDMVIPDNNGNSRPQTVASYGLSRARTPGLDANKYTLQLGYQSREHAAATIPERRQPSELRHFWNIHHDVLNAVEGTTRSTLNGRLGLSALTAALLSVDLAQRDVHIRTNWYVDAMSGDDAGLAGREVLSGHADRGPFTLHLYETHGGFLKGAPYPRDVALSKDGPARREAVSVMLDKLEPVEPNPGNAAAFLGAGWWNLPPELIPDGLRDLPALYHVGAKPNCAAPVSPYACAVTNRRPDRLSVVAFVDPPVRLLQENRYSVPPRSVARPTLSPGNMAQKDAAT